MLLLPTKVLQAGHKAQVLVPETLVQELVRQLRRRHRCVAAPPRPAAGRPGHVRREERVRRASEDAPREHELRVNVVRVDEHTDADHPDAIRDKPDLDDRLRSRRDAQV